MLEKFKNILPEIVDAVLDAEQKKQSGEIENKKEFVLDIAAKLVNTPFGDGIEKQVFSMIIDGIVYILNRTGFFKKS